VASQKTIHLHLPTNWHSPRVRKYVKSFLYGFNIFLLYKIHLLNPEKSHKNKNVLILFIEMVSKHIESSINLFT